MAALLASSVYNTLATQFKLEYDAVQLEGFSQSWLRRANDLIQIGFSKEKGKAVSLVERRSDRFGQRSLLRLAFIGHLRKFISNTTRSAVFVDYSRIT